MHNCNSEGQTETRKVSLSRNVDFKIMDRMTMNVMASAGKIFLSFRFWSYYRNIERFGIISSLKFGKFLNFRIANHVEPELGNMDWVIWKVCRRMSTYSNAYAKVKNWIFDVYFRKFVWVLYHFKWFLNLYNLSSSDQISVRSVKKSKKSSNST